MELRFYEDPLEAPRPKEEVRIRRLGLFVYEDRRRVAVGFDLTPFLERPSIEVAVRNAHGHPAGSMQIVDAVETNFTLTMHLRDKEPTDKYTLQATLYYASPERERLDVHTQTAEFDVRQPGEK